jgi:hypothetical protein
MAIDWWSIVVKVFESLLIVALAVVVLLVIGWLPQSASMPITGFIMIPLGLISIFMIILIWL